LLKKVHFYSVKVCFKVRFSAFSYLIICVWY